MNDNQLAQKVKALRKNKGYSQEGLSEISGLSLRTVQRIENENKNPSGDTLRRLSTALEVSPDYLLEWEPNENSNFLLILAFSPILSIINPILAIIVPLILWSIKKNQIRGVKQLGIRVLKIQIIWLIVYFIARTINFLRLTYIVNSTPTFIGEEWDSFLSDVETQYYLKMVFVIINILITLFITYKTYRNNQFNNSKFIINHSTMKACLFLFTILLLPSCNKKTEPSPQEYIEPCEYNIMSYQVKDSSYHDSVKVFLSDNQYISIIGDSIFKVTDELGQFLFNGNNFTYKLEKDSLILLNNDIKQSYKILDLAPNSFRLEVSNKYFKRIDMIKPKGKRRRIDKIVKIKY